MTVTRSDGHETGGPGRRGGAAALTERWGSNRSTSATDVALFRAEHTLADDTAESWKNLLEFFQPRVWWPTLFE
jgi:hypothetical protein